MPLSDHEQRQLEQIEQALSSDYPRLANAVRASDPRVHYRRRFVGAALGFLAGAGMLVAGIVTGYIWMSVAGFVVMVACGVWGLTSYRHMSGVTADRRPGKSRNRRGQRSRQAAPKMMDRLEERWRRRQERDR